MIETYKKGAAMVALQAPVRPAPVEPESAGMTSEAAADIRPRWRRYLLPVTYSYALLLVLVSALVAELDDKAQARVVLHASTNLHNLLLGHFGTLFSSAFVIGEGTSVALLIIPLLVCLLALAELRFGSWPLVRIFLAGHVGTTLLVAFGLWVAVQAQWLPVSITHAQDVGISYGAMAVIGAFVILLPQRWRATWAISWIAFAVAGVAMGRTFTNVGHLVAVSIGLLAGIWLLRTGRTTRLRSLSKFEIALLATGSALGYLMLVG
jgi:hypothetical protein